MANKHYKEKVCANCGKAFIPRSGVQKVCDDCKAKAADRPKRQPAAAMMREYNRRQKETIRKLQDEIATMKAKTLAPRAALISQIESLKSAIERQRKMVGESQRLETAAKRRVAKLCQGIRSGISSLQGVLDADAWDAEKDKEGC